MEGDEKFFATSGMAILSPQKNPQGEHFNMTLEELFGVRACLGVPQSHQGIGNGQVLKGKQGDCYHPKTGSKRRAVAHHQHDARQFSRVFCLSHKNLP